MANITWSGNTATVDTFLNGAKFESELAASAITIASAGVSTVGSATTCVFKAALSETEKTVFASLVAAHDSSPTEEQRVILASMVENHRCQEFDLTYKMRPYIYDIPASAGLHTFDISFPYPIMLLGGTVEPTSAMVGDFMQFDVLSPTVVTALTAACIETDTTISVAAVDYIWKSFQLYAVSGETDVLLGEVKSKAGNMVTLASPLDDEQEFSAGTYIKAQFTTVEKTRIMNTNTVWISRDTDRGALVCANTISRFYYWNTDGAAKTVQITLEYYV